MNKDFENYSFKISTPDMFTPAEDKMTATGPVWHGTAIGWHDDMNSFITQLESNHERFSCISLCTANAPVFLVSLYSPTHGKDDEFLECVSDLTEFLLSRTSENDTIIIGADTNCSSKSTTRRRKAWGNFCETFCLKSLSSSAPTFHHHNGTSESCIDTILVSMKHKTRNFLQLCTLDFPTNFSSHDVLITTISVTFQSIPESKYSNTYIDFNREHVLWEEEGIQEYQSLSSKALSDALEFWDTPESIPLLCSLVSNLLVKSAKLVFKVKKPGKKTNGKKSQKFRYAEDILMGTHRAWKKAGKPLSKTNPIWTRYARARSNLQRVARSEENMQNVRLNNNLMSAKPQDRNKVFSMLKNLRNSGSKSTTNILETPAGTFYGDDVLEGFAADAEFLGRPSQENGYFDKQFYDLCILDNLYIFNFKGQDPVQLPHMSITDLENILDKKMKLGKACDVYQLTVEHLRYCGISAKLSILKLLNRIIDDIYYLTCPQVKLGLGSALHKGKNKPTSKSKSYRRITVTPYIGSILDRYVDPIAEKLFRKVQSPDQLGFTEKLSYLMAAVQRGECQRWALDQKQTCFGVSLDGEAAFPSVEREIQIRELYSVGERGDLLTYSKNTYENTECHIKEGGRLSRRIR